MFELDIDNTISFVKKTDKQWRVNGFRDLTLNNELPIWDTSWNAKASNPFYFIDKTPNFSNLNPDKSLFETARFRDYYMGARLFFNPVEDYKITLDFATTQLQNKNR